MRKSNSGWARRYLRRERRKAALVKRRKVSASPARSQAARRDVQKAPVCGSLAAHPVRVIRAPAKHQSQPQK